MLSIAGLAGNRGRNLLHLDEREPGGATLSAVIADDATAPVLDAAAERGIPTAAVEPASDEPREAHEERLLDALADHDVDLVCLDGYMRVLTERFLDAAPPTLNVHPSLLPAFPGLDVHERVLDAGVRTSGCTVHVVTEAVDEGPIVTQAAVPVFPGDDPDDLAQRVLYDAEFAAYPRAVRWFAENRVRIDRAAGTVAVEGDADGAFPARRAGDEDRVTDLRYGENPHQDAALYADATSGAASVVDAPQLNDGAKALSYNNYNDADAALSLVAEFDPPAAAVIKHANPAGCATASSLAAAYADALATDPKSAFGGIVALNRECDRATAEAIVDSYKEVVVAPDYDAGAREVLTAEDDLRVLAVGPLDGDGERFTDVALSGGRLVQERDRAPIAPDDLEVVTERAPTDAEVETMLFAWRTIVHAKSNAIVFADGTETVGLGVGQPSRVDAVEIAARKADRDAEGKSASGAVMASDAFFPFPDGVEVAAEAGIEAVIQPGGSVNDDDVIAAADEHGVAMALTGRRAFRHD